MIIKNSNIRRSIFENRYVIFVIIFGIILTLYIIQLLNANAKEKMEQKNNEIQNTVTQKVDKSSQPIISGEDVSKKDQQSNTELIEQFIRYCNNQQIEKAYNLLTNDCKEEVFGNNIEYFKKNYVDKIFTTKKMCTIQSWINSRVYTYKVKIFDDMLSTGQIIDTNHAIEDYYTIVKQENSDKLNINSYIAKQEIKKEVSIDGMKVSILNKNIYKQYEEYEIKLENTANKTILLDSQEKADSIYLIGSNENHYNAFSYEVDRTNLIIEPKRIKTMVLRFDKIYSSQVIMRKMVFEDIITDYETYEQVTDKKQYSNRQKIVIEL